MGDVPTGKCIINEKLIIVVQTLQLWFDITSVSLVIWLSGRWFDYGFGSSLLAGLIMGLVDPAILCRESSYSIWLQCYEASDHNLLQIYQMLVNIYNV